MTSGPSRDDAAHLGQRGALVRELVQRTHADNDVDGRVADRQRDRVAHHFPARPDLDDGARQHGELAIHHEGTEPVFGEGPRVVAGPSGHVQDRSASTLAQEPQQQTHHGGARGTGGVVRRRVLVVPGPPAVGAVHDSRVWQNPQRLHHFTTRSPRRNRPVTPTP
jgi:hypothetical protein